MDISSLPSLNAALNTASASFLVLGVIFIRQKLMKAHTICMLTACMTSTLFLASYLYYHYHAGSRPFEGQGLIRVIYFTILLSHTILAMVIVPMAMVTLWRGLTGNFIKHAKIARITFPLWLYVSVTGVVIYWMLYRVQWS